MTGTSRAAWLVVGAIAIGAAALADCGGDDTTPAPTPTGTGAAGAGGSGGSGGSGGANAGNAGTAGKGGSAGSAGAAGSGGKAGSGGSGGGSDAGSKDAAAGKQAMATLEGRSGIRLSGSGTFTQSGAAVNLVVNIQLDPADAATMHGIHIHEVGDCGAADAGALSAGIHWNPFDAAGHGYPTDPVHHLGDIGNINVAANGMGSLTFTSSEWSVGTGMMNDVVGHALMIHADHDDGVLGADAYGHAGARIGCGVIVLVGGGADAGGGTDSSVDVGVDVNVGLDALTGG